MVTDEGNLILDLHLNSISDEDNLSAGLNLIPGVVENGLFVNICKFAVLADENEQVTVELKDNTIIMDTTTSSSDKRNLRNSSHAVFSR